MYNKIILTEKIHGTRQNTLKLEMNLTVLWTPLSSYLNQNDLVNLCQVAKDVRYLAQRNLYHTVRISRCCVLRDDQNWLDGKITYLTGLQDPSATGNQNDMFLWDKIERFMESDQLLEVRNLIIEQDLFDDVESGKALINRLILKLVNLGQLESIDIRDSGLSQEWESEVLALDKLKFISINDLTHLTHLIQLKELGSIKLVFNEVGKLTVESELVHFIDDHVTELIIESPENKFSSYKIFQSLQKLRFSRAKSLKFPHVHQPLDFAIDSNDIQFKIMSEMFSLEQITRLEVVSYCDIVNCHCFEDFALKLAPHLTHLKKLGLIERTIETEERSNHYKSENWDISIGKFITNIPQISQNLKTLSIRHSTSSNGECEDAVDGNYIRRRKIYDQILPHLKSLTQLILPNMLQSIAPYEMYSNDFLWNGCTCDFCQEHLPIFDEFIMNHQIYDTKLGKFKDMSTMQFLCFVSESLTKRIGGNRLDWDTDILRVAPVNERWNFHDPQRIHHFNDYSCSFENKWHWGQITKCIEHFLNGYMYHMVQYMPSLRVVMINGIYFHVERTMQQSSCEERYVPNHETFFTTIVDTSTSKALKCPIEYYSIHQQQELPF